MLNRHSICNAILSKIHSFTLLFLHCRLGNEVVIYITPCVRRCFNFFIKVSSFFVRLCFDEKKYKFRNSCRSIIGYIFHKDFWPMYLKESFRTVIVSIFFIVFKHFFCFVNIQLELELNLFLLA